MRILCVCSKRGSTDNRNSNGDTTDTKNTTVMKTIDNCKHKMYQLYSSVQSIMKNVVPGGTKKNDENSNSPFPLWIYYSDSARINNFLVSCF